MAKKPGPIAPARIPGLHQRVVKGGEVVQKVALARWSRTLSALVGAGVPILQAIEVTGKTAGNKVVEDAMDSVHDSVKRGGTIAGPLK